MKRQRASRRRLVAGSVLLALGIGVIGWLLASQSSVANQGAARAESARAAAAGDRGHGESPRSGEPGVRIEIAEHAPASPAEVERLDAIAARFEPIARRLNGEVPECLKDMRLHGAPVEDLYELMRAEKYSAAEIRAALERVKRRNWPNLHLRACMILSIAWASSRTEGDGEWLVERGVEAARYDFNDEDAWVYWGDGVAAAHALRLCGDGARSAQVFNEMVRDAAILRADHNAHNQSAVHYAARVALSGVSASDFAAVQEGLERLTADPEVATWPFYPAFGARAGEGTVRALLEDAVERPNGPGLFVLNRLRGDQYYDDVQALLERPSQDAYDEWIVDHAAAGLLSIGGERARERILRYLESDWKGRDGSVAGILMRTLLEVDEPRLVGDLLWLRYECEKRDPLRGRLLNSVKGAPAGLGEALTRSTYGLEWTRLPPEDFDELHASLTHAVEEMPNDSVHLRDAILYLAQLGHPADAGWLEMQARRVPMDEALRRALDRLHERAR